MASRGSRDVSLTIRAKDEAAKGFESVAAALASVIGVSNKLGDAAGNTGGRLDELASMAGVLDKAYAQIVASAGKASAALDRQNASIAESKSQLAAVQAQAASAAQAIERLKSGDAVVNAGRDQGPRLAQLRQLEIAYEALAGQQNRLVASIAAQESSVNAQRGSLQQLGSTVIAAEEAQARLAAQTAIETEALHAQTAAAEALHAAIAANTGLGRAPASASGAPTEGATGAALAELAVRDQLIQKLKAEEAARASLMDEELAQARAAKALLPVLSGASARDSAAVFSAADAKLAEDFESHIRAGAAAETLMAEAAAKLRAQLDPAAAVQARLNSELAAMKRLLDAGKISATEFAGAEKLLADQAAKATKSLSGKGGAAGFLGLEPWKLQNLSFQVNDIFTQLASGTSVVQTLGQQSGQIVQIFPQVGKAIFAAFTSPAIIAFIASLAAVTLGVGRVIGKADELHDFEGTLLASADGARFQAEALQASAHQLDLYGISAADAVAEVRTFLKDGVDPARIVEFGRAAKDLADVLGIDVKDAAKQVGEAFTKGFESVDKLDKATNFLEASEREYIRTLFESGHAAEARNRAFEDFAQKQHDAAEEMRGPWTDALTSLGNAWDSFVTFLANDSIIKRVADALSVLAEGVTTVLDSLGGNRSLDAFDRKINDTVERIVDLRADIAENGDSNIFGIENIKTSKLDALRAKLADLIQKRAALAKFQSDDGTDPSLQGTNAQQKIDADIARTDAARLAGAEALTKQFDEATVAKRLELTYTTALNEALAKGASDEAARASALQATRLEALRVQKEITAEKAKQATADEQAIRGAASKIVGVESGGDASAVNGQPGQTATGLGQFIEDTWLSLFRKNFPAEAATMGRDAILELRKDAEISKKMIEAYARDNAAVLKKAGLAVTEANLGLAHFLGPDGAVKVLQAAPGTPVKGLLPDSHINANPGRLQGKTTDQVIAGNAALFGDASAAQSAIAARLVALAKERADAQAKFNEGVSDENQKRTQTTQALEDQKGLIGTALLDEQRREAVADALLAKQQEIDRRNVDLRAKGLQEIAFTDAQKKAIEQTTAAYFDLAHAKDFAAARRDDVQRPVDDLLARRDSILAQIVFFQQTGEAGLAEGLEPQLAAVNEQLDAAIAKAVTFYEALAGNADALAALGLTAEQIQVIIDKLEVSGSKAADAGRQYAITGKDINQAFTGDAVNALDQFAQKVAAGEDVFKSLGEAFQQFAADFLRDIAQMILKTVIFNLVSGGGSGEGGLGGAIIGALGFGSKHGGGIVGAGGARRMMRPAWFNNAARMHGGGIVGLKPGERPIIAMDGEEVLTEDDPNHSKNRGRGGRGITIVNALDTNDAAQKILGSPVGEEGVLNIIRMQPNTIRSLLGV